MKRLPLFFKLGMCAIALLISANLYSQVQPLKLKVDTKKTKIKKESVDKYLREGLKMSKDIQLQKKSKSEKVDKYNQTHEKYTQYYKGVVVENSDIRVHSKNGDVFLINGDFASNMNVDMTKHIREDVAIDIAIDHISAHLYKWELPEENLWLKEKTKGEDTSFYPQPSLVICENELNQYDFNWHLAYKIEIFAHDPVSHDYVYVSTRTGDILKVETLLQNIDADAITRYSEERTISTDYYQGVYRLRDYGSGDGVITYNLQNSMRYSDADDFYDLNNIWDEYDNIYKDNGALDAHWGGTMSYKYFNEVHGRNGYDDNDSELEIYIHYGVNSTRADFGLGRITLGDGAGDLDIPSSIDIVAHEYAHGVNRHSANLGQKGERGAINEGLSDIWAACVEEYANDVDIWLMGEDPSNYDDKPALRSLRNPNETGNPDTYKGDHWYPTTGAAMDENSKNGIHRNSTVMSHWFYRLCEGGLVMNDFGGIFVLQGIGMDAAAQIVYRAETVYMTSKNMFSDARMWTVQAAEDIFGISSPEYLAVNNAWEAIGVHECDRNKLENEVISTNTTIEECNIDVRNVTVTNNSKLTLDYENSLKITPPFVIEQGSEVQIKQ